MIGIVVSVKVEIKDVVSEVENIMGVVSVVIDTLSHATRKKHNKILVTIINFLIL